MSKLPEGVPVFIAKDGWIFNSKTTTNKPNGIAYTFEQLAELKEAIARAAFFAGVKSRHDYRHEIVFQTADDYLQSEQFKKLVGEM